MQYQNTYCNPTPLPDYPLGRNFFRGMTDKSFRETADPTVLYENGRWYLYSSCGMAYESTDFITWKHHRIEPYDIGYAPTVVKHRGKYYLAASFNPALYCSDSPLGPFKPVGKFTDINGAVCNFPDVMLFADDDGRLYVYGCLDAKTPGIIGAELDAQRPTQLITPIQTLIRFSSANTWECFGEWNQNPQVSYMEGPFMYKKNGVYYLTYCAPGTEFSSYAMGAYMGSTPLGPFRAQKNNPITAKKYGIVRGPGHGCIVDGPNDTIWAFYTCTMCYAHPFERRIGYDRAYINETGELCVSAVTELPQWAPGIKGPDQLDNNTDLLPLTFREPAIASSFVYGREPIYAADDSMLTWWEPEQDDREPTLTISFKQGLYMVYAARIIWRDVGMDIGSNILPGAFGYVIEAKQADGNWVTVLDKARSQDDFNVDYQILEPVQAAAVRLRVVNWPQGITPGVISFCIFGKFYR